MAYTREYENQVVYVVVVDGEDKYYPVIPEDHEDNLLLSLPSLGPISSISLFLK